MRQKVREVPPGAEVRESRLFWSCNPSLKLPNLHQLRSLRSCIRIFFRFFSILYDFFTLFRRWVQSPPIKRKIFNVGYKSTHQTPDLGQFWSTHQAIRAKNGQNQYPTLTGIFGGPRAPHHSTTSCDMSVDTSFQRVNAATFKFNFDHPLTMVDRCVVTTH